MVPVQTIFERAPQLLGGDTATLAAAANLKVGLVADAITPGAGLTYADITLATFDGYAPLIPTPGTQPEGLDPNNGDAVIDLAAPVGGWRWEMTGLTIPTQTIYGFVLYTTVGPTLYAAEAFDSPITLNAINQAIVLPRASLRFNSAMIS